MPLVLLRLGLSLGLALVSLEVGSADASQVVVAAPEVTGELSSHWRGEIASALSRGVGRAGVGILSPGDCDDVACLRARARAQGAVAIVTWTVAVRERFYRIRMVAQAPDGSRIAAVDEDCPICGPGEVAALVERHAAALVGKIPTHESPGHLSVVSTPTGAEITVDGVRVGQAPKDVDLAPGEHVVRLTAVGFEPLERTVVAVSQVKESWTATMRAIPAPLRPRQRQLRIAGISLLGAAAAAAVPAIIFIALDGRPFPVGCSGPDIDADGDCRRLYRTLPHGGAFLGLAVALAAAGGTLLTISRRPARRNADAARVRPAGLGARVRF